MFRLCACYTQNRNTLILSHPLDKKGTPIVPLLAFHYTEALANIEIGGHYDAEQQLWVGDSRSISNLELDIVDMTLVGITDTRSTA